MLRGMLGDAAATVVFVNHDAYEMVGGEEVKVSVVGVDALQAHLASKVTPGLAESRDPAFQQAREGLP
jgi:hypothetical protein